MPINEGIMKNEGKESEHEKI